MTRGKTVIVDLPACNAVKTLEKTIADVPPGSVDEFPRRGAGGLMD
jgi:hypothetical protein